MARSFLTTPPFTFVGIGEVLFDIFEDGTETLGGAPLNVAVHLNQLADRFRAGHGIVVSSIGSDSRGDKITKSLKGCGMSTGYLAMDDKHSTGLVSVYMRNGEPGYQIEADAAWDYIYEKPELNALANICCAVCFGSLAQRSDVSRKTIRRFLEQTTSQTIRLYDVNLRENTLTGETGYSPEIIDYSCQKASIIKANQRELFTILTLFDIDFSDDHSTDGIRHGMEALLSRFPAQVVVVTLGDRGTVLLNRKGEFDLTKPRLISGHTFPVGAGDACSAGIIFGMTLGWDIHTTMELANRMGADVAACPSATPLLSNETLNFVRAQLHDNKSLGFYEAPL